MSRHGKKTKNLGKTIWLITFADLMTLLICFFVLLLSMSTMDATTLARISAHMGSVSPIAMSGPGRIPERIQVIVQMLREPQNVLEKRKRLKDLLFPLDVLPKEMAHGELEKNLEVLAHPEGVVIVLTEELLFAENSFSLDPVGKKLLDALTPVIQAVNADINISGHLDPGTEKAKDAYELSFMRAASVLEHFLQARLPPDRFSLSGYGPDRPMHADANPENRIMNRRVEILIKTTSRISSFI
jgi:chemotaxis protein MotB